MPFIEVTLVQGRTSLQLRALITGLTDATETALGASRSTIRVVLREVPETHWAAGDVTIAERNEGS
jgi:4-oxalocrotonate tautomerase